MSEQFDVLIIGGGVIGLACALAMAERQHTVAIIDAGSFDIDPNKEDIRVYAFNQASQQLFKKLGAWQHVDLERLSPYQYMHVWDSCAQAEIDFDTHLVGQRELGFIIEESALRIALLAALLTYEQVQFFPYQRIVSVKEEEIINIASETKQWQGRFLIAADGANSPVRQLLNCPITTWPYHQHAIVARVQTELSHQKTAWQIFNANGPLAFLPLKNNHCCSIVWSTDPKHAQHLMGLADEEFNAALTQAFEGKLGQAKLLSPRHQFPLVMRHTARYTGANWILMGDAAHTIHPLAGLGLNVGLADLATFLNLQTGKTLPFTKSSLMAYQRQRKHAVWQVIALMEGLKWTFSNPFPPFVGLRQIGLQLANRLPGLKRLFIEHAN